MNNLEENFAYVLNRFYLWTDMGDMHVGEACRRVGFWEMDLTAWMFANIQPGFKCLDIGSNIGYYTEVLARTSGKDGKVWAFEPNADLVTNYKRAQELNSYEDAAEIVCYDFGLSNENIEANLYGPLDNIGGSGIIYDERNAEGYFSKKASFKRLDSFFDEEVDFIKIDVEGHEPSVFEGMPESVLKCPLVVAELGPYHPESFLRWIEQNYSMETIHGDIISVERILSHPHHLNIVLRKK